jgi:DNA-binding MarR family transcriptional regulator
MSRDERIFAGIALLRHNQVLTQMLDEAAAEYLGINTTDGRAIDVIDQAGRITAGDLARELRLSTGAVTAIVDRLERAGYARRVADPSDRRRVLIEVTPLVHKVSQRIYGSPDEAMAFVAGFSDDELEVFQRFQEASKTWLEERLARVDRLNATQRERKGRKRLSGRGRA